MRSQTSIAELRAVSRVAFGQAHRLELMLAIASTEDGLCTLTELSKQLNVTMSSLQRPFQALVELGLITALPDADSRYRYYSRNPSPAWGWAAALAAQAGAGSVSDGTGALRVGG